jgi:probable sporulation protein (polysaccharide deacetylase family)
VSFFIKRIVVLFISVLLIIWVVESPCVSSYIIAVKEETSYPVFQLENWKQPDERTLLYKKIQQEAVQKNIKPINARVDKVWKTIPGYNGRIVDINATFQKSLKQKDKKISWVYREITPDKNLDDLGANPIYRGNEQKKMVALMVNVAWGSEYLERILYIFKQENVKATFFLDGSWLAANSFLAKKIIQEGHEIGNHGYSHPLMTRITRDRIYQEIKKTQDLIHKILNVNSRYFAPPAGDFDQRVVDIALRLKMKTILWTLDTVDWKKSSLPKIMIKKVEKNSNPGTLILMHPTDRTVEALPQIIDSIKKKGMRLGTVSDVLSSKRVE